MRCVDGVGLCTPEVPSGNGRTFLALRGKRWENFSQAEWNRVFYASAPMGAEVFLFAMRYLINRVKKVGRDIKNEVKNDIDAVKDRDPAARSSLEILLTNQGVHAILLYRVAHLLDGRKQRFIAKLISQFARFLTGIEIHPSARIGRGLLIDHGAGVVIGETAEIGDDCTIFHGVTLGGTGKGKGKRHPTLRDGVFVGAGAKILGNIEIGANAKIGANAVVLTDVPENATAVGVPARVVV